MALDITDKQILELEKKANKIRQLIIEMLTEAKSGHPGGPLGMADIFAALYFHVAKQDPKNPDWPDRDRIVLSNGHICPVRYAAMALAGFFPIEELKTLRKIDSRIQGHPHRTALPGVETTSGPLGEGLSQAIGIALAGQMDKKNYVVYALTSDGEHQEGNTWEAAMMAGKYKLSNLIQIIDRNYIQIDGSTEKVMPLEPFKDKYESFNWAVLDIDGNNMREIVDAIGEAKAIQDRPVIIIANTVPGKHVSYMENNYLWHGNPPDLLEIKGAPSKGEQAKKALEELKAIEEKLNSMSV
jgi:transketolase